MEYGLAPSNETEIGLLNNWFNMYVVSQKPVLIGHIGGQRALESEEWSDVQLKDKGRTPQAPYRVTVQC